MRQCKERLYFQNQASVRPDFFMMSQVTENQMLMSWTLLNQCVVQQYNLTAKIFKVPPVNPILMGFNENLIEKYVLIS